MASVVVTIVGRLALTANAGRHGEALDLPIVVAHLQDRLSLPPHGKGQLGHSVIFPFHIGLSSSPTSV